MDMIKISSPKRDNNFTNIFMKRNNDLETCHGRRKTVLIPDGKLTEEY